MIALFIVILSLDILSDTSVVEDAVIEVWVTSWLSVDFVHS